ncbi:MAG: hypothetical protein ACRDOI_33450 [Trebonia sp.]
MQTTGTLPTPDLSERHTQTSSGALGAATAVPFSASGGLARLRTIRTVLDELRETPDDLVLDRGHQFLAEVSEPSALGALLEAVRSAPEALRSVAAQSYRHVNHFDKIVLIGNPDPGAFRLTLHSWTPPYEESEVSEETIHDHRFNFWSAILFGTQLSLNYVEHPNGAPYRKYKYSPENRDVQFSEFYEYQGEVRLLPHSIDTRHEGSQYYLSAGETIHQVLLPLEAPMASLVLRGPRLHSYSNCFNTSYPVQGTAFENAMFSPEKLDAKLEAVCSQLAGRVQRDVRGGRTR